jgi:AraC-like DNA-binding protein
VGKCSARLEGATAQASPSDDVAQQVRRLLLSRVNDRLSINDVAMQLGVSPTRAKQAWIWQAKRLLCDLSLTIRSAASWGFSSHSYFSQVFFQHTGETPTDLRRRNADSKS